MSFLCDARGSIVTMSAIGFMVVILFSSIVLSGVRRDQERNRMQQSADAGAIAGAIAYTEKPDKELAKKVAVKYYRANFSADKITVSNVTVEDSGKVTVRNEKNLDTLLLKNRGGWGAKVLAAATGGSSTPPPPTPPTAQGGYTEVALVLDVTTSMAANNKMTGLKQAANLLIEDVLKNDNTYVSLIPFNSSVRLDALSHDYESWLDPQFAERRRYTNQAGVRNTYPWRGCLLNNLPPYDVDDISYRQKRLLPINSDIASIDYYNNLPSLSLIRYRQKNKERTNPLLWKIQERGGGGNSYEGDRNDGSCILPSIIPLGRDKDRLTRYVDSFWQDGYGAGAASGTIGSVGLLWGWRSISPLWTDEWFTAPKGFPKAYKSGNKKALVFLTDGVSEIPFNAGNGYGIGAYGYAPGYDVNPGGQAMKPYDWNKYGFNVPEKVSELYKGDYVLDERMRMVCDNIKAKTDITLYVVGFGLSNSGDAVTRARNTLEYCASNPGTFFRGEDNESLKNIFRKISESISAGGTGSSVTTPTSGVRLVE